MIPAGIPDMRPQPEPDPEVSRKQARQIAAQLFQVEETAISLSSTGAKWLRVAIPHQAEQLPFRGPTWAAIIENILRYLAACVERDPNGAAQAAAAAKLGDN